VLPYDYEFIRNFGEYAGRTEKKAVHTQTDNPPSVKLNPLAAGYQTSFKKGEIAYVLMI
jgi:hypothetical protein